MSAAVRPIEAPRVRAAFAADGERWAVWDPSAVAPVMTWFDNEQEAEAFAAQCRQAWIDRPTTVTVTLTEAEMDWILSSLSVNRERLEAKAEKLRKGPEIDPVYATWTEELLALRQRFATVLTGMNEGRR